LKKVINAGRLSGYVAVGGSRAAFITVRLSVVELRRFIGPGIAASAAVHLSIIAVVMIFAEVHPFTPVTAEPIAVDIVTPEEASEIPKPEEQPKPQPKPKDVFDFSMNSASSSPASASAPPLPREGAAAKPEKQAAVTPPPPSERARSGVELQAPPPPAPPPVAATQFAPAQEPLAQPTSQAPSTPSSNPSYVAPQPDLSVKYNVVLGLPPPPDKAGGFDAVASEKADIASGVVAAFRQHLRTCSKLPSSIGPSESVRIKLRVVMKPDGRIAAPPSVVEGSASIKALDLKQSAVEALQACQPYTMLPPDRYREWKVLDLVFSPEDFNS
jgi:hypothetical protein